MVVGDENIENELSGTVGFEICGHVVTFSHHVGAHLVEGGSGDKVALTVDLPGDRTVRRANLVVALGTGEGSGVYGEIDTHPQVGFDDHSIDEVGVVVGIIIDDHEHLALNTNSVCNVLVRKCSIVSEREFTENTVIEWSLVLVGCAARSGSRVGPLYLVGLSDFHGLVAVLPFVGLGELLVFGIVVVALESLALFSGKLAAIVDFGRTACFVVFLHHFMVVVVVAVSQEIELNGTVVIGSQVPMDVDGAESL